MVAEKVFIIKLNSKNSLVIDTSNEEIRPIKVPIEVIIFGSQKCFASKIANVRHKKIKMNPKNSL